MRSRLFIILLTVAVTLAVGVCPCGRALMIGRLAGALFPVAASSEPTVRGPCPACHGGDPRSDPGSPDARRCAASVAGDVPAVPVAVPAVDVTPAAFQPAALPPRLDRAVADRDRLLRPGLPPPPTLLNLACCLNT